MKPITYNIDIENYIKEDNTPNSHRGIEMCFKEDLKEFDNFLLLNKGLQTITREGHITSINVVLKRADNLTPSHKELKEHILWMNGVKYSHSHITNTSKAIEYYTEFLGEPLIIAKTRRPKKIIKGCLSEAEINAMIRATKNLREKAMIVTLAYSGIRNKEFCNLKVKDIDFGNNTIRINNGKYSKDRITNISAICSTILIEYLIKYNKDSNDYLFTTIKRNNQYHTGDLRKLVKTLAKRVGIKRRVFVHLFRQSLATNLHKRGARLLTIKEQLGHSYIESTLRYILIYPQGVKSEYESCLPAYV